MSADIRCGIFSVFLFFIPIQAFAQNCQYTNQAEDSGAALKSIAITGGELAIKSILDGADPGDIVNTVLGMGLSALSGPEVSNEQIQDQLNCLASQISTLEQQTKDIENNLNKDAKKILDALFKDFTVGPESQIYQSFSRYTQIINDQEQAVNTIQGFVSSNYNQQSKVWDGFTELDGFIKKSRSTLAFWPMSTVTPPQSDIKETHYFDHVYQTLAYLESYRLMAAIVLAETNFYVATINSSSLNNLCAKSKGLPAPANYQGAYANLYNQDPLESCQNAQLAINQLLQGSNQNGGLAQNIQYLGTPLSSEGYQAMLIPNAADPGGTVGTGYLWVDASPVYNAQAMGQFSQTFTWEPGKMVGQTQALQYEGLNSFRYAGVADFQNLLNIEELSGKKASSLNSVMGKKDFDFLANGNSVPAYMAAAVPPSPAVGSKNDPVTLGTYVDTNNNAIDNWQLECQIQSGGIVLMETTGNYQFESQPGPMGSGCVGLTFNNTPDISSTPFWGIVDSSLSPCEQTHPVGWLQPCDDFWYENLNIPSADQLQVAYSNLPGLARGWDIGGWDPDQKSTSYVVNSTTTPGYFNAGESANVLQDVPENAFVLSGDFNGDGLYDLAYTAPPASGTESIFLYISLWNAQTKAFDPPGIWGWALSEPANAQGFPLSIQNMVTGDFNKDGYHDIAYINPWGQPEYDDNIIMLVILNTQSGNPANMFSPAPEYTQTPPAFPEIDQVDQILSGDFNGDGYWDLAYVSAGSVYLYLANSDATFSQNYIALTSVVGASSDTFVQTGDFNSDSVWDFVSFSEASATAVKVEVNYGSFSGGKYTFAGNIDLPGSSWIWQNYPFITPFYTGQFFKP